MLKMFYRLCFGPLLAACFFAVAQPLQAAGPISITGDHGTIKVLLTPSTGRYVVSWKSAHWSFAGSVGKAVSNASIAPAKTASGEAASQINFPWPTQHHEQAFIRCYADKPVVEMSLVVRGPAHAPFSIFPALTSLPQNLHIMSFENHAFYSHIFSAADTATPWLLFDKHFNCVVISPIHSFMTNTMIGDGNNLIGQTVGNDVTVSHGNLRLSTMMVFGNGVEHTFRTWGHELQGTFGRTRTANDAGPLLKRFGYWTDNGAVYYYRFKKQLGYAGTLLAVKKQFASKHIPLAYMQLDSWWYQKSNTFVNGKHLGAMNERVAQGTWNHYGGTMLYKAAPELFPNGLAAFQKALGLPLVTHGRWIDLYSPYRKTYKFSGVASIDPRWWDHIVRYLHNAGVICYEQDWLNYIYRYSPQMARMPGVGEAFTNGMAAACKHYGLAMEYCMETPRFLLQGARYDNLTSVRVATDQFCPARYDDAIYNDAFARAIGSWPWVDNFRSAETENLAVATLTAGPVGVSDAIGKESPTNIFRSIRADGVIVKPDEPIEPTDQTILSDARNQQTPLIASTYTRHGILTRYVFVFRRQGNSGEFSFTPASLGISGHCYVFDEMSQAGNVQLGSENIRGHLLPDGWRLYEICPITNGLALVGDEQQFVPTGKSRISSAIEQHGVLALQLTFAKGEASLPLAIYAASKPTLAAKGATIVAAGYANHLFTCRIERVDDSAEASVALTATEQTQQNSTTATH